MTGSESRPGRGADRFALAVAAFAGVFFVVVGVWAMADPGSFFERLAKFEPYNQHFLQDIGAFQIGLGAVLILATWWKRGGTLGVALLGVGIGSAAHVVSHLVGTELGGTPEVDLPFFGIVTALLLGAAAAHARR